MRAAGVPVRQIAEKFGVTDAAIYLRLKQRPNPRRPAPEVHAPARWRVERDRTETRYARGWTACDTCGNGAWFPTWAKAWRFAITRAQQTRQEHATRTAEQVALLQTAFPWSTVLTTNDRARFASEVAAPDSDTDAVIEGWRAAAIYASRGLMKARGTAS